MRRLRDVDTAERVHLYQAALWGLGVGAIMSIPVGMAAERMWGWPGGPATLIAFVAIAGAVFGGSLTIIRRAGQLAGTLHSPSGRSTPYQQDFSRAAALVARGDYPDAAEAYQVHIGERPEDPEPYLRLARLLRDQMGQYDEAAAWFKAGRREARITPAQEVLITHELIELFGNQLDDPVRAAPEFARLIQRFPDSPEARWARTELTEVKKRIDQS